MNIHHTDMQRAQHPSSEAGGIPGWLHGNGMGRMIFAYDWSESELGPIHAWPAHLKMAVDLILSLPSAAILLWGPNFIQIYNDAYRDLMGRKHPNGLGQGVAACWPEAWDFVGPVCHSVMREHKAYIFDDQRLILERLGSPEE